VSDDVSDTHDVSDVSGGAGAAAGGAKKALPSTADAKAARAKQHHAPPSTADAKKALAKKHAPPSKADAKAALAKKKATEKAEKAEKAERAKKAGFSAATVHGGMLASTRDVHGGGNGGSSGTGRHGSVDFGMGIGDDFGLDDENAASPAPVPEGVTGCGLGGSFRWGVKGEPATAEAARAKSGFSAAHTHGSMADAGADDDFGMGDEDEDEDDGDAAAPIGVSTGGAAAVVSPMHGGGGGRAPPQRHNSRFVLDGPKAIGKGNAALTPLKVPSSRDMLAGTVPQGHVSHVSAEGDGALHSGARPRRCCVVM
jgi:hypothetical protein